MLTETMTHAEVYRELDRDRETATVWWRHHLDTLRRPLRHGWRCFLRVFQYLMPHRHRAFQSL